MKTNIFVKFVNTLFIAMIVAFAAFEISGGSINPVTATILSYVAIEALSLVAPKGVIGADVYADTVLQQARAFIKADNNKKFQLRPQFTNIIEVFKRDREFTMPGLSEIRQATTQTTKAMYLKKKTFTVGSAKSCSPSGEQSGSGIVELTWATKPVVIQMNWKQFAGNEVAMATAFANELYNAEVSLWESVDNALLTYLEANKSGVNNGQSGTFDSTNDIMSISYANKDYFYNLVTADMKLNNYSPTYFDVYNTMWDASIRKYINQGAGNSTNTEFQFAGFEFSASNLVSAPVNIGTHMFDSIHYIVPSGGVAILDWNDPLNRAGKVSGEKSWGLYQSMLHPEFNLDLYKVTGCSDTSSSGGGTQDYTETYELSFNYALAKQPVPTADETPIYKYGTRQYNS